MHVGIIRKEDTAIAMDPGFGDCKYASSTGRRSSGNLTVFQVVLAMSDQQLVTGLAITISGYSQLVYGISFYHWRLITTLAWFSTATHLATLLFLGDYLKTNTYIWYARIFCMTALAVMLAVAIVPTGLSTSRRPPQNEEGSIPLGIPARCAFDFIDSDYLDIQKNGLPMALSEVILLGGLLIRFIEMSSTMTRLSGKFLWTALGRLWRRFLTWLCEKLQGSPRPVQVLLIPLVLSSLVSLVSMQALLDFLRSDICGVCDTHVVLAMNPFS